MPKIKFPLKLLLEVMKEIEVEGPCGKIKTMGVVDTGATHVMIAEDVYKKTCLWDETSGFVTVASGDIFETKAGFVNVKLEECPGKKVLSFVGPFTLIGMNYLSEAGAVIDAKEGTVTCKLVEKKLEEATKV